MAHDPEAHAAHAGEHHDHRKLYYAVFGALMLGTLLTVVAAMDMFHGLGRVTNIVIALIIACVKASLVGYIFMHLREEDRVFYGIALFPIVLFLVMVFLLLPDVGLTEPSPLDTPGHELYKGPAKHGPAAH